MIRRISPVDRLKMTDEEAKAKMVLVLGVVSGIQTISDACRESGLKALSYYKLEERLMEGMYQAALMPAARRGRPKDLASEANQIAAQTEELRREYRQMQSLVRITRRIFRTKGKANGAPSPKKKTGAVPPTQPAKE